MDIESCFQASYARLVGEGVGITDRGQRFFSRFYDHFIASSSEVEKKFINTDMERQVQMLQKSMYQMMSFYLLGTDGEHLQKIALSHARNHYDISPELYDLWLDALLHTVSELDDGFTPEAGLAWRIVMTPGILYMKHYYDHDLPE